MENDTCAVEDCDRAAVARGWCNKHYQRWKAHGDPLAGDPERRTEVKAKGQCAVQGCEQQEFTRGWCSKHYDRWRAHGDPLGGGPGRRQGPALPCKAEGCEEPARTRGWCKLHYQRWCRTGDAEAPANYTPRGTPLRERIEANVAKGAGCWFWLGSVNEDWYGQIRVDGETTRAHQASYLAFVGPVPDGMELDHLCRNRTCCNPAHLEPVPHVENVRRGEGAQPRVRCGKGHGFTPENTRLIQVCLTCERDARDRRAEAKRAAKPDAA